MSLSKKEKTYISDIDALKEQIRLLKAQLFCRTSEKEAPITPPTGLLEKAISYTLNQWHRLVVYADIHHVSPDNNMAENTIRPFTVGRKNWLFNATPEGAAANAVLYSLIETAKANWSRAILVSPSSI